MEEEEKNKMEKEIVVRMPDSSEVCLKVWEQPPFALSLTRNGRVVLKGTEILPILKKFREIIEEAIRELIE